MVSYCGYVWKNLGLACDDLGLSKEDVLKWAISNNFDISNLDCTEKIDFEVIKNYVKYHRVIVKGLIFDNLAAAAKVYGVTIEMIKPYLAKGFGFDLSCHMALHGIDKNIFERK